MSLERVINAYVFHTCKLKGGSLPTSSCIFNMTHELVANVHEFLVFAVLIRAGRSLTFQDPGAPLDGPMGTHESNRAGPQPVVGPWRVLW